MKKLVLARLFGTPEFRSADGASLPVTPKLVALVALLDARHPVSVTRTDAMDMLWSRMSGIQARQNLRKALNRLRRILGDEVVVARHDQLGLNTANYDSDTLRLDRHCGGDPSLPADQLLDITPADFLAGLDIKGDRWADWLTSERQHLRYKLLRALTDAARTCASNGDLKNARSFAQHAVRTNPLAEEPRRILMQALADDGRASEAIQEYQVLVKILRDELSTEPSSETVVLMDAICRASSDKTQSEVLGHFVQRSLAVLPIRVLGDVKRGLHLSVGLSADIVTTLAKISDIDIIDLSVADPSHHDVPISKAQTHGAQSVLRCSLQVVGDRVRLTAQLIEAETNKQIWAERFDQKLVDLLDIQDSLTKDVVTHLQVRLTEGEQARIWSSGTECFEAWEFVVRATRLIHTHHREGILEARRLAEQAVSLDPNFASAHAAIGWTHWVQGRWFWSADRHASFDQALRLAEKALLLDPANPDARTLRGVVLVHVGRYRESIDEMEQAVDLSPSHAHIAALAAYVHRYAGDPRRAIELIDRSIRLSPGHPPWYLNTKAAALCALGEIEKAEAVLREAFSRDPQFTLTLALLASVLGQSGRISEATDAMRQLLRLEPGFSAEGWCAQNPYRNQEVREVEKRGLIAAGAPP